MRLSFSRLVLFPWLALHSFAATDSDSVKEEAVDGTTDENVPTLFNDQKVPPMKMLNGKTYEEDIAKGWWLVEAYSPWCGHCQSLAPKLQTIYEFYYTSDPVHPNEKPLVDSLNTFTKYYDFHFAKLDCVAFGTACSDLGVKMFPTLFLIKDGIPIKTSNGDRTIEKLGEFIESSLETIKPGSRPAGGPQFPKVGAKSSPMKQPESSDGKQSDSATKTDGKTKKVTQWGGNPKYKVAPAAFIEPQTIQNPEGKSVNFSAATFDDQVTKSLDPWFVKFYAPWCPHCQHMVAAWDTMAKDMKGKLNVGEVNCDIERKLCLLNNVRSYPTIKLLRGPEHIDYDGLRGVGDLLDFGNRIAENLKGINEVSLADFEEMEKTEDVVFVYFYDVATTSEDFQALERLPLHLNGRAKLVKTQDPDMVKRFKISTWPQLVVSKDGLTNAYPGLSPANMRDVPRLINWIQKNWLPLVPELTAANAKEIMQDKYVALGILSRERKHDFEVARKEIKSAAIEWLEKEKREFEQKRQELRDAKQMRVDEAAELDDERKLMDAKLIRVDMNSIKKKSVGFAWVDGIFWERWLKTTYGINILDGDRVLINDDDNHYYWDVTETGHAILPTRASILETLSNVVSPRRTLQPKITGSFVSYFFFRIGKRPVTSLLISLGGGTALYILSRTLRRRKRSFGSFGLGGKSNDREGLLGMSNGASGGKSD